MKLMLIIPVCLFLFVIANSEANNPKKSKGHNSSKLHKKKYKKHKKIKKNKVKHKTVKMRKVYSRIHKKKFGQKVKHYKIVHGRKVKLSRIEIKHLKKLNHIRPNGNISKRLAHLGYSVALAPPPPLVKPPQYIVLVPGGKWKPTSAALIPIFRVKGHINADNSIAASGLKLGLAIAIPLSATPAASGKPAALKASSYLQNTGGTISVVSTAQVATLKSKGLIKANGKLTATGIAAGLLSKIPPRVHKRPVTPKVVLPLVVPALIKQVAQKTPTKKLVPVPLAVPGQKPVLVQKTPSKKLVPAPLAVPGQRPTLVQKTPSKKLVPAPLAVPGQKPVLVQKTPQKTPAPIAVPGKTPSLVQGTPQKIAPPVATPGQTPSLAQVIPVPQMAPGAKLAYYKTGNNGKVQKLTQAQVQGLKHKGAILNSGAITQKSASGGLSYQVIPKAAARPPALVPIAITQKQASVQAKPVPKVGPSSKLAYFQKGPNGKVKQLTQAQVQNLKNKGAILNSGGITNNSAASGLTYKVIPKAPPVPSNPFPHILKNGNIPLPKLPAGSKVNYFKNNVVNGKNVATQLTPAQVSQLKSQGRIHPGGALTSSAKASNYFLVVTPPNPIAQLTPAAGGNPIPKKTLPPQQTPVAVIVPTPVVKMPTTPTLIPVPLAQKPSLVPKAPVKANPAFSTGKVPAGAGINYFAKGPNGSVIKLGPKAVQKLKSSGAVRPNGSLSQAARNNGFSTQVTPPRPGATANKQAPSKPKTRAKNLSQVVRPANSRIIYHAPVIAQPGILLGPKLASGEVDMMKKNGFIYPDGALSIIASNMGYKSTVVLGALASTPELAPFMQKNNLDEGNTKIVEKYVDLKISELSLGKGKGSGAGWNWLWPLLLIPAYYIRKKMKQGTHA